MCAASLCLPLCAVLSSLSPKARHTADPCWHDGCPPIRKATTASTKATLVQFPLKVAHAITAHKIQGQTITKPLKVALDISSIFEDAQAHVMLSRVEEFEQMYILDKLPEENIRASKKALDQLQMMNARSINQNPIPWNQEDDNYIKIATLNCMNLMNN